MAFVHLLILDKYARIQGTPRDEMLLFASVGGSSEVVEWVKQHVPRQIQDDEDTLSLLLGAVVANSRTMLYTHMPYLRAHPQPLRDCVLPLVLQLANADLLRYLMGVDLDLIIHAMKTMSAERVDDILCSIDENIGTVTDRIFCFNFVLDNYTNFISNGGVLLTLMGDKAHIALRKWAWVNRQKILANETAKNLKFLGFLMFRSVGEAVGQLDIEYLTIVQEFMKSNYVRQASQTLCTCNCPKHHTSRLDAAMCQTTREIMHFLKNDCDAATLAKQLQVLNLLESNGYIAEITSGTLQKYLPLAGPRILQWLMEKCSPLLQVVIAEFTQAQTL